jgi:predicted TIM-barrel fold metal-dependent hydrolase
MHSRNIAPCQHGDNRIAARRYDFTESQFTTPIAHLDLRATRADAECGVIIAGHIGYPWTEEMIAVATKHENVYIDTSA